MLDTDLLTDPLALITIQKILCNKIRIILQGSSISRRLAHDIEIPSNERYAQKAERPIRWRAGASLQVFRRGVGSERVAGLTERFHDTRAKDRPVDSRWGDGLELAPCVAMFREDSHAVCPHWSQPFRRD